MQTLVVTDTVLPHIAAAGTIGHFFFHHSACRYFVLYHQIVSLIETVGLKGGYQKKELPEALALQRYSIRIVMFYLFVPFTYRRQQQRLLVPLRSACAWLGGFFRRPPCVTGSTSCDHSRSAGTVRASAGILLLRIAACIDWIMQEMERGRLEGSKTLRGDGGGLVGWWHPLL